eukprot:TRINITY_DN19782_c1_g2_i4.p2 TRINITY_DN19782_c1_g2~~TRINITY_DN19782_c1_g2_i4.p2  ORF type:complete len:270 (-),score=-4.11 TRINITY_DN19782_c1_g2_i4:428-1237(-)
MVVITTIIIELTQMEFMFQFLSLIMSMFKNKTNQFRWPAIVFNKIQRSTKQRSYFYLSSPIFPNKFSFNVSFLFQINTQYITMYNTCGVFLGFGTMRIVCYRFLQNMNLQRKKMVRRSTSFQPIVIFFRKAAIQEIFFNRLLFPIINRFPKNTLSFIILFRQSQQQHRQIQQKFNKNQKNTQILVSILVSKLLNNHQKMTLVPPKKFLAPILVNSILQCKVFIPPQKKKKSPKIPKQLHTSNSNNKLIIQVQQKVQQQQKLFNKPLYTE